MVTLNQLLTKYRKNRKKKKKIVKKPGLDQCPQKKGICLSIYTRTPKKPNSGIRKVAKIKLSNKKKVIAYIPGEGHDLMEYSIVLIRGGKVRDLPGVKYKIIRGKLDLGPVLSRKKGRSKVGTKKMK